MRTLVLLLLAAPTFLSASALASHDCVVAWTDLGIRRVGCVEDGVVHHVEIAHEGACLVAWGDVGIRREGCVEEDLLVRLA